MNAADDLHRSSEQTLQIAAEQELHADESATAVDPEFKQPRDVWVNELPGELVLLAKARQSLLVLARKLENLQRDLFRKLEVGGAKHHPAATLADLLLQPVAIGKDGSRRQRLRLEIAHLRLDAHREQRVPGRLGAAGARVQLASDSLHVLAHVAREYVRLRGRRHVRCGRAHWRSAESGWRRVDRLNFARLWQGREVWKRRGFGGRTPRRLVLLEEPLVLGRGDASLFLEPLEPFGGVAVAGTRGGDLSQHLLGVLEQIMPR